MRKQNWYFFSVFLAGWFLAACGRADAAAPNAPPIASLPAAYSSPTPLAPSPSVQPTQTASASPTLTLTPSTTPSPTPTDTASPTPQPTYSKLRGEVVIEQAVCHYGPGAPYLYKYGVYQGSHLEILRRLEGGNYLEIQAIGGSNPCWVKTDYLKIENGGSLHDLEPVRAENVPLPWSPYYPPLTGVSAQRQEHEVRVSWHGLALRAGDDSEQVPYILEAWVCQQGEMVFRPVGSYRNDAVVVDEPGCGEPSHAFVTAAEKHGYTRRVAVPWPPAAP